MIWARRRGRPAGRVAVMLYTRAGCHLCEQAEAVLRAEQPRLGFDLETVDIDHDPALADRYGVRVPVVAVDGVELFDYEVPADLLAKAVRRARRSRPA